MVLFQCRTQHCMWCNRWLLPESRCFKRFNAARSMICGATHCAFTKLAKLVLFQCRTQHCMWCNFRISETTFFKTSFQCRTQHDMWCNPEDVDFDAQIVLFQCRTQHDMWCNRWLLPESRCFKRFNAARSMICGATHCAFTKLAKLVLFQCRTQHDMWCNKLWTIQPIEVWKFQCRTQHDMWCNKRYDQALRHGSPVSMPHAA